MRTRQAICIVVPSTQTSAVSKPHNLSHTFFKVLKTSHITLHHHTLHWLLVDARIKSTFVCFCFVACIFAVSCLPSWSTRNLHTLQVAWNSHGELFLLRCVNTGALCKSYPMFSTGFLLQIRTQNPPFSPT